MKRIITITAEDLEFIHETSDIDIANIIGYLYETLNGNSVQGHVPDNLLPTYQKLDLLTRPVKNPSLGTAEMCQLCADRLNGLLGTKFKPNAQSMKTHVSARLKEGYTQEDFLLVIDKKVSEWASDDRMRQYLRPETLFGTKFEGYLNQPHVVDGKATISTDYSQADYSEGL